eukprot:949144-Rhodomonas_salina.1
MNVPERLGGGGQFADAELHSCDLAQAFVQADKLHEGVNGRIFIRPPQGAEEEIESLAGPDGSVAVSGVVGYRVSPLRQLE